MQGTGVGEVSEPSSPSARTRLATRVLLSALLVVIASTALGLLLRADGPILTWDSKDYAQVARQIVRGKGMTSKLAIRGLLDAEGTDPEAWPSLIRPPVPVYVLALTFRLLGVRDSAVPVWASLFFLAAVLAMFWAFEPLFGPGIAFAAAAAFAVSRSGVLYAASGLTESSAMFFLAVALVALLHLSQNWGAALIGLSMGACALTRPVAYLWVAVLAAGFIFRWRREGRRWHLSTLLLAACFLLPVLTVAQAVHWQGGRAALAINLAFRTGGDLAEAMRSPVGFVWQHPVALARKMVIELGRPTIYGFRFGEVILFSALGVFGLAARWSDPRQRLARAIIVVLVVTNALALSVLNEGDAYAGPLRYFDVFAPLIVPWGVAVLWMVRGLVGRAMFVALLAVMLLGSAIGITHDPSLKPRPGMVSMYRQIATLVPESEIIAADQATEAPAIAWYSDRYVVWPCDLPQDVAALRARGLAVKWYFGRRRGSTPPSFRLVESWPGDYALWSLGQ